MPKVVLVGTESHILSLLQSRFEQEGFEVAAVAEEGWQQQISDFPPDLIVLGKRFGDAVSNVLGNVVDVPIILLTAGDEKDVSSPVQPEIAQLKMPFRPSQLLELAYKTLAPA